MFFINNILFSGFEFNKDESLLKYKFKFLNSILMITFVFAFIFAVILYLRDIGGIQVEINFLCSLLSILLTFYLRKSKNNYKTIAYLLLTLLLITFTSALIFVPQDEFRMVWFYVLIYIAYTMLGNVIGLFTTILSILIILFTNMLIDSHFSQDAITTAVLVLIIASFLSRSFNNKTNEYEKNLQSTYNMLEHLNRNLEYKIAEEIEKNRLKEEYLREQTRLAQMGEMMSMIAHQWRQPLGAISATSIDLKLKLELEHFDFKKDKGIAEAKKYFLENLNHIDTLVQNLTVTIDDFRNFYKPNKKSVKVKAEKIVEKSLKIIKSTLTSSDIDIQKEYNSNIQMRVYENELMQVVLNILKNAKDNFEDKGIKNPHIKISTKNTTIQICDNGGGISEENITKIFDPYFSTKDKKIGTGLGLYMSKTIIEEHHNGKLSVVNKGDGVCFILEIGVVKDNLEFNS